MLTLSVPNVTCRSICQARQASRSPALQVETVHRSASRRARRPARFRESWFRVRTRTVGGATAATASAMFPCRPPSRRLLPGEMLVWLWVENPQPLSFGPYTQTATLGGVTVTATAQVASATRSSGDGQVVTCGAGTAFDLNAMRDQLAVDSPSCGFRYQTTSGSGHSSPSPRTATGVCIGRGEAPTARSRRATPPARPRCVSASSNR